MYKKGFTGILTNIMALIVLTLIMFLFFTYVKFITPFKGVNFESVDSSIKEADMFLLNYLRTPVEIDLNGDNVKENLQISDLIAMVDVQEGQEDRIKLFQEKTKEILEKQYPTDNGKELIIGITNPWWLRVYGKEESVSNLDNGKYFSEHYYNRGYTHTTGLGCDPKLDVVSSIAVPKTNGDYVNVIFCIKRAYIREIE